MRFRTPCHALSASHGGGRCQRRRSDASIGPLAIDGVGPPLAAAGRLIPDLLYKSSRTAAGDHDLAVGDLAHQRFDRFPLRHLIQDDRLGLAAAINFDGDGSRDPICDFC